MHEVNDIVVKDGSIVLSNLPFADGQHVRVVVAPAAVALPKMSVDAARKLLAGRATLVGDPAEPMVPEDAWEQGR